MATSTEIAEKQSPSTSGPDSEFTSGAEVTSVVENFVSQEDPVPETAVPEVESKQMVFIFPWK